MNLSAKVHVVEVATSLTGAYSSFRWYGMAVERPYIAQMTTGWSVPRQQYITMSR